MFDLFFGVIVFLTWFLSFWGAILLVLFVGVRVFSFSWSLTDDLRAAAWFHQLGTGAYGSRQYNESQFLSVCLRRSFILKDGTFILKGTTLADFEVPPTNETKNGVLFSFSDEIERTNRFLCFCFLRKSRKRLVFCFRLFL